MEEEFENMNRSDLIDEIIENQGDHIGLDYITVEELKDYCGYSDLTMLNSTDKEAIIDDIIVQLEKQYYGSVEEEMDEAIADLVNGDFDSRVHYARTVTADLYNAYDIIKSLRNEIKLLKEDKGKIV